MLSNSLQDLQEHELLERTVVEDKPVEVEYSLTGRGESLESVIEALEDWGQSHFEPAPDPESAAQ